MNGRSGDMLEAPSVPWWDSKLLKRLEMLCGLIALAVALYLAFQESLSWVGWAVAGVVVILAVVVRWPTGAFLVLCVMSVLPHYFVQIFGWKARAEHFASGLVALAVGIGVIVGRQKLRLDSLDYWVLAYLGMNFLSSAIGSPAPASTLRWALQSA